jgi:hypothetical protein
MFTGSTMCELTLSKLCPEIDIGVVNMMDKEIIIELKANLPGVCLNNAHLANIDNALTANDTYKIG